MSRSGRNSTIEHSMRLFTNARFCSMEAPDDHYAALLEKDGTILRLYRRAGEIPADLHAERIDLDGAWVYPGFTDTHTHSFDGGLYSLCLDLGGCSSLRQVLEALAGVRPLGGLAFAWNLDVHRIREGRFPNLTELDRAVPDIPLIVKRVDGHSCMVNSAALRAVPWKSGSAPQVLPLTRELSREASAWFQSMVDEEGILSAYDAASRIALKAGLTRVHTMVGDGESDPRHFVLLRDNLERFDVDFVPYPQISNVNRALELGSPRVGGCLLSDGSIGSHTAALNAPYADQPESRGTLYRDQDFWYRFVREAHREGLQACVHAIGEAAVEQIAGVLRRVYDEDPKALHHQIIHCEMVSDRSLELLEGLPAAAPVQPAFDALWGGEGGLYEKHLGKEGRARCNRYASLARAGVLLTGGSDWYITPLDPLGGIRAATRLSNPAERLSPFEAIRLYTVNAAKLTASDDRQGYLREGYECDLSIVSGPGEGEKSAVKGVVKEGKLLFLRGRT